MQEEMILLLSSHIIFHCEGFYVTAALKFRGNCVTLPMQGILLTTNVSHVGAWAFHLIAISQRILNEKSVILYPC